MTSRSISRILVAAAVLVVAAPVFASTSLFPFAEVGNGALAPAVDLAATAPATVGALAGLDALGPRTSLSRVAFSPVEGMFDKAAAGRDLVPPGIGDRATEGVTGVPITSPRRGNNDFFLLDLGGGKLLSRNPQAGQCEGTCDSQNNPRGGATP